MMKNNRFPQRFPNSITKPCPRGAGVGNPFLKCTGGL